MIRLRASAFFFCYEAGKHTTHFGKHDASGDDGGGDCGGGERASGRVGSGRRGGWARKYSKDENNGELEQKIKLIIKNRKHQIKKSVRHRRKRVSILGSRLHSRARVSQGGLRACGVARPERRSRGSEACDQASKNDVGDDEDADDEN